MVDTQVLGTCGAIRAGSSPVSGTFINSHHWSVIISSKDRPIIIDKFSKKV